MMGAKILVVDDERVIREFLHRVLERAGYTVRTAADGNEALQKLHDQPFDLLLTDIKMDHLDGIALLEACRTHFPDMAVILLTGHATVESAVNALRKGAYNYLLKPVRNEDILAAVRAGLRERAREERRDRLEQIAGQLQNVLSNDFGAGHVPAPLAQSTRMIRLGEMQLDEKAHVVTLGGVQLGLTPIEFRLLHWLSQSPGTTYDFGTLVQAACGYSCPRHEAREIIGTHVRNLRNKMKTAPGQPLFIESVRAIGYRLIPPGSVSRLTT